VILPDTDDYIPRYFLYRIQLQLTGSYFRMVLPPLTGTSLIKQEISSFAEK
jgi:hypothetical protein